MKLQRVIGQTSQILNLFVQDFSATTGAGIANIPATTVSYTWFHNTQAAASTGTGVSTASMGTYTSGAWTQISSSLALGWYQFGIPDGALATGDCVGLHIYVSTGAFNMAPLPIEIELVRDNPLQFTTSKVFLAHTSTSPANIVQIQGQNAVTSASGLLDINVANIVNSAAATSAAGQLLVSTQAMKYTVNVTAWANSTVAATSSGIVDVNLVNIWNKSAVTSASGTLTVSTQSLVGIVVSTQTMNYSVNITSIVNSAAVTSGAGILNVSTQSLSGIVVSTQTIDKGGYGVTTNADKSNYTLSAAYDAAKTASQAGDAMALTSAERGTVAGVILSTTQAESYRASSATGSITQLMYEVLANVTDFGNSGTTRALNSVTSHAVGTLQYQYDSTTPSSITRIA